MLVIDQITRTSTDALRCRIHHNEKALKFTARLVLDATGTNALDVEGIEWGNHWRLCNSDDYKPLITTLWKRFVGVSPTQKSQREAILSPEKFMKRWRDNGLARVDPEYAPQWGSDELMPCDPDRVPLLSISEEAKRFLIWGGLPFKACHHYSFAIGTSSLQTLPHLLTEREMPPEYQRYRIIGIRYFDVPPDWTMKCVIMDYVCLDEKEGGQVVVINNVPEHPVTYLNASVQQMAEFFLILRSSLERGNLNKPGTNEEWAEHCQTTFDMLQEVDPKAVKSEMGWYNPTIWNLEMYMDP